MAQQVEKQCSNTVKTVESMEQLEEYLKSAEDKLVVIDFYADWCGPCKMIAPRVAEMAEELTDVIFLKVNVDDCEDIAEKYGVQAMPTFKFFIKEQKVDDLLGANAAKLREKIQGIITKQVKS